MNYYSHKSQICVVVAVLTDGCVVALEHAWPTRTVERPVRRFQTSGGTVAALTGGCVVALGHAWPARTHTEPWRGQGGSPWSASRRSRQQGQRRLDSQDASGLILDQPVPNPFNPSRIRPFRSCCQVDQTVETEKATMGK